MLGVYSSFLEVGGPPYRYTIFLVVRTIYEDAVRDELNHQAEAFAADMGGKGFYARAFAHRIEQTHDEVTNREWPEELAERFRDDPDPVLLVLDRTLSEFNPREHSYALIWVSDFRGDPHAIRPALQILALKIRSGDDVIEYLRGVAERSQREARKEKAARAGELVARFASYLEIKPSFLGLSIDLKALLGDIARRRDRVAAGPADAT